MIYGKKYRVLPLNRTEESFHGAVVVRWGDEGTAQKVVTVGGRDNWRWMEDSQVELIPEELQNESLETILLYYSL